MARISEESKQRVREATDLVELAGQYTELRRAGVDRMVGLCPLHDERTASFTISPAKQLFKCFGCDAGAEVCAAHLRAPRSAGVEKAAGYLASRGVQRVIRDSSKSGSRPPTTRH